MGHGRFQRRAADEHDHRAGVPGEVHRRLPGGVRPADDVDLLPGAAGRLGQRGAVEHAAAGQRLQPGSRQLPVGHAGRQDDRVGVDLSTVGEVHRPRRAVGLQADDVTGGEYLGAEFGCLSAGTVGELRPGDSVGEAEIVLDP